VLWHGRSEAVLNFCRRAAESDITVMPSVTCMDWLCWWYNHKAHVVSSSTALAFVTKMSEKCKSISPSAIQVKNRWKTMCVEEKLDISCQLEKANELVTYGIMLCISICPIRDNADRITESSKSGTKVFVWQDYHSSVRKNCTKHKNLHFYCIRNK